MAAASVAQPAPWTVIVETEHTLRHFPACDEYRALRAAWVQATTHAGQEYAVTIRIDGPDRCFPALTIPAAMPDPEPEAWELEPEPVEDEEDDILAALATWR